jgi:hypothetical protein
MKTLLICHAGDRLNETGLARWLASFSELGGIVAIDEPNSRLWKRVRREVKRVGAARFPDVLAFRLYYRLVHATRDRHWEERRLHDICETYPPLSLSIPILHTSSPNTNEAVEFISKNQPDIMIARCKTLLKESVFSIPSHGTFAMHPGICPEYRNAHGCFWALANGDPERVGMTLLRIDKGVDTGAVYGYYSCSFDDVSDSHIVIQHRVVFDNLDELRNTFEKIYLGHAVPIDTSGRASAAWGQPWLTRYFSWKRKARRKRGRRESHIAAVS